LFFVKYSLYFGKIIQLLTMKKMAVLVCLWAGLHFALALLPSCTACNGGPIVFQLHNLTAELKRIEGIELGGSVGAGNYVVSAYNSTEAGIRYDSLGIDLVAAFYAANDSWNAPFTFGMTSAYACSPAEHYEQVQEIIISSSENYNAAYPKGADLQEIMSVRNGYWVSGNSVSYLIQNGLDYGNNFFTFNFPPDGDKRHDMTIKFILEEGKTVETSIRGLLIKK
jgi:hypothetical protein